jgi:hypothetical protein
MRRAIAIAGVLVAGCQGEGRDPQPPPLTSDATVAVPGVADAGDDSDRIPPDAATADDVIAELGAIPAWQAVVDRDQLLARREQRGVVYGTLAAGSDPRHAILVDDTEGNGCLAIRVLLPSLGNPPGPGERVAIGGAWVLDDDNRWEWKAEAFSIVPPSKTPAMPEPKVPPGLVVGTGSPPTGWRMVSKAKDDGVIVFQVLSIPQNPGDGWRIADELGDKVIALLFLPGERPSYGGHDMRTADERWTLKRGVNYWVRTGKIRRKANAQPDAPVTINARTPPVKW